MKQNNDTTSEEIFDAVAQFIEFVRLSPSEMRQKFNELKADKARLDFLEKRHRNYSTPPMRAVTGTVWELATIHKHGKRPTLRAALDKAMNGDDDESGN